MEFFNTPSKLERPCWQCLLRSCFSAQLATFNYTHTPWLETKKPESNWALRLCSSCRLPGGILSVAWWYPDSCLVVSCRFPGGILTVAWWYPVGCLVVSWQLASGLCGCSPVVRAIWQVEQSLRPQFTIYHQPTDRIPPGNCQLGYH